MNYRKLQIIFVVENTKIWTRKLLGGNCMVSLKISEVAPPPTSNKSNSAYETEQNVVLERS